MPCAAIMATGVPLLPVKAWSRDAPHLSDMVVHFQAACCLEKQNLVMSPAFQPSCPSLCEIFENVCRFKGSKWPKPVLPPDEEVRVARDVMQEVIPWVLQELPTYMQAAGCWDVGTLCLTQCGPLKIAPPSLGKDDKKNMKSYKEAWVLANCGKSVGECKMYEAGGNLLWLNPEVWCEKFIPGPEPSWAWVVECANRNFHVVGGSVRDRIMFPIPLAGAWCRDVGELVKGFPIGMKPLGSHGFLYGWHLAVLRAMEANDKRRVEMLCEAALTATITLYAECDKPTLLMHAMHFLREATRLRLRL